MRSEPRVFAFFFSRVILSRVLREKNDLLRSNFSENIRQGYHIKFLGGLGVGSRRKRGREVFGFQEKEGLETRSQGVENVRDREKCTTWRNFAYEKGQRGGSQPKKVGDRD